METKGGNYIVVTKYTRRINGEPKNHLLITKPAPELSTWTIWPNTFAGLSQKLIGIEMLLELAALESWRIQKHYPPPLFPTSTQQYNSFNIYMKSYYYIILDFLRAKMTTILVNTCLRVLQKLLNFSTWLLFQQKNLEKLARYWFSASLLFAFGNKFT